jgi:AraC-like DNA-binding protein
VVSCDYLSLRAVRLRWPSEWLCNGEGVSFCFVKDGTGAYSGPKGVQPLGRGESMMVAGAGAGKIKPARGEELNFGYFSLMPEHLFPLLVANEILLIKDITDRLSTPKVYQASHAVSIECQRLLNEASSKVDLDHRVQLLRLAVVMLAEECAKAREHHTGFVRMEDHVRQVFEALSADELLNLSVGAMAKKFGCSRRHLNRLFHSYFGTSVAALRMEVRLLKAGVLLRDPSAKVINVAENCGFNHLGLFNACFKRRFGASPGKWRKSRAEAEMQKAPGSAESAACPLVPSGLCPWNKALTGLGVVGTVCPDEASGPGERASEPMRMNMEQMAALQQKLEARFQKRDSRHSSLT